VSLAIMRGAIGPHVTILSGPQTGGGLGAGKVVPITASLAKASVTIQGSPSVTTPSPITFGAITAYTPALAHMRLAGAQGIMGIGQLPPGYIANVTPLSPLVQLATPLWEGYTIALNAAGGPQLMLGRPTRSASSVSLPLLGPRVPGLPWGGPQGPLRYPNGAPAYQGAWTLCWRVGGQQACGATIADSGQPDPIVGDAVMPNLPHVGNLPTAALTAGIPVTVSTPVPTKLVLRSYVTSLSAPARAVAYAGGPAARVFNAGLGLYFVSTVGFDLAHGQVIITRTGSGPGG
jgi:hypothetical protein